MFKKLHFKLQKIIFFALNNQFVIGFIYAIFSKLALKSLIYIAAGIT